MNLHHFDQIKIGRLDDRGKVVEYVDLSTETGMDRLFTDFAEMRSESETYRLEDLRVQAEVTFKTSQIDDSTLLILMDEARRLEAWRQRSLEQIRLWVNDVRGGDPAPLDRMLKFADHVLFPVEMTWDYLERLFMSTDQAWERLEMSLGGYSDTDLRMACKSILYLMMREGEDNGELSPFVE